MKALTKTVVLAEPKFVAVRKKNLCVPPTFKFVPAPLTTPPILLVCLAQTIFLVTFGRNVDEKKKKRFRRRLFSWTGLQYRRHCSAATPA